MIYIKKVVFSIFLLLQAVNTYSNEKPTVLIINEIGTDVSFRFIDSREVQAAAFAAVVITAAAGNSQTTYQSQSNAKKVHKEVVEWERIENYYIAKIKELFEEKYGDFSFIYKNMQESEELDPILEAYTPERIYILKKRKFNGTPMPHLEIIHVLGMMGVKTYAAINFELYELKKNDDHKENYLHFFMSQASSSKLYKCTPHVEHKREGFEKEYQKEKDETPRNESHSSNKLNSTHIPSVKERMLYARLNPSNVKNYTNKNFECFEPYLKKAIDRLSFPFPASKAINRD